jgi:hypothetical protein
MLVASKALGHANTRTISRYAHYFDETASEVVDKFGEYLKAFRREHHSQALGCQKRG